ncbi:30S ribosomal protein S2, partial [candidate division TM6 bacterium RIFCSPHIGHO2_12_FULL_32_22]
ELSILKKNVERLKKTVGGIIKLNWPVGALVVVDVKREATAIKEALQCGVPVVALIDTNSDPSGIDYVIPGNDDSPKSIKLIMDYLSEAVERGQEAAKKSQEQKKAAKEAKAKEESEPKKVASASTEVEQDDEDEVEERTSKAKKPAPKPKFAPKKK